MADDIKIKITISADDKASAVAKKAAAETTGAFAKLESNLKLGRENVNAFNAKWGETLQLTRQVGVGMTAAGASIVGGLTMATKATMEYGSWVSDAAKRTGVAAESLGRLRFAAEQSAVDVGGLETGLTFLQRNMNAAAGGSDQASAAFKALGIEVVDGNGKLRDTETVLMEAADKITAIESPAQRTALAMQIFGRSGAQLLPLLSEGSQGIREMGTEAERLGLVMSGTTADKIEEFGDSWDQVKKGFMGLMIQVGQVVIPILDNLFNNYIIPGIQWVTAFAQAHPTLTTTVTVAAGALGLFMTALGPILIALPSIISGVQMLSGIGGFGGLATAAGGAGTAATGMGTSFSSLAAAGGPIALTIAAVFALVAALAYLKSSIDEYKKAKEGERKAADETASQKQTFGTGQIGEARAKGATIREIGAMEKRGEITHEAATNLRAQAQDTSFAEGTKARTVAENFAAAERGRLGPQGMARVVPGGLGEAGAGTALVGRAGEWLGQQFRGGNQQEVRVKVEAGPEFKTSVSREVKRGNARMLGAGAR